MKKKLLFLLLIILLFCPIFFHYTYSFDNEKSSYGVFTGADNKYLEKMIEYDEIVIDASYFSKEDIEYLHKNNVTVYSYLNIGSLEEFRPCYEKFKDITLSKYDNWEGEQWIDVSNKQWQEYILYNAAKKLSEKNVDGFFIDNVDIYYLYNNEEIYNGIYTILTELKSTYNKSIIVNGGYEFIKDAIEKEVNISELFNGVNQEEVFTYIHDYDNNIFKKNLYNERKFILAYLGTLKEKGIDIYVIEYSKNEKLNRKISKYFSRKSYKLYISSSIDLT